ncbi:MAG: M23 family metallopeptidase [Alcaligenaceae bacterium]|nr:M23 family metallopeptidase [Alcaligenaceae bacterium]
MFTQGNPSTPSYRTVVRARKPRHFIRNGLAFLALGLFAGAGALAVVQPPDTPVTFQARETLSLANPLPEPVALADTPYISETTIRRGDTLAALLQRLHVQEEGLQQFLVQNEDARSIYKLYPGRSVQAALNAEGRLVWLRYNHTPGTSEDNGYVSRWLEITPTADGGFAATEHSQDAETHTRIAEGTIESSLFGATDAAGIPDAVTLQMTEILGSKIDFIRDLRKGDRFRLVYETYSSEGRDVGAGRILALEFINNKKVHEAVWFKPDGMAGGYYDFDGASLRGSFLRSALKFSRISSGFGMRKHPIHGSWRGHKGVDYAAPTGTPIHATGDGVVDFIGTQGGYGNTIVIKHHSGYKTLYAHQSRFAAGLKKGASVAQGELIGYVGSTGWSTGPHLHYEFRVNDTPVDPLSVDLPVARPLDNKLLKEFRQVAAKYEQHINFLASYQEGIPENQATEVASNLTTGTENRQD